jgi:hypothetical protein
MAGTGGTTPDASSSGGDGGGDANASGGAPSGGFVRCGPGITCELAAGEACCVQQAFPGAPDTFACRMDTTDCNQHVECDSDSDCPNGACCLIQIQFTTQFHAECRPSCASDIPFECGGKRDCAPGESCCGTTGATGYSEIRCEPSCAAQAQVLCDVEADCDASEMCRDSAVLPGGLLVCAVF